MTFFRTIFAVALLSVGSACAAPEQAPAPPAPEPPLPEARLADLRQPAMGDFDTMLKRGYLRVLVAASPTNYFIKDGVQGGTTYAAARAFEAFLKSTPNARDLKVVILPVPAPDLITALNDGRGDLVANILITPDREEPTVTLVAALTNIRELVVTAPGQPRLLSIEDLEGRSIYVRRSSAHFASLERINQRLKQINKPGGTTVAADESLSDEALLAKVDAGELPATLVDSHVAALWKPRLPHVSINEDVAISQDAVIAWAIRKDSPALLDRVNAFVKANGAPALFGSLVVAPDTSR
ncbi:MAG: transporter substrate-binding domain-containing protein [Vicinamibacterales bacterium]